MIVYFVGMHNKVGMTALDSRTKTGKVIDSVIEKFKDVPDIQFVKTNLCDTDYLPKETALHAGQWHARFSPTKNDVVITLGRWVKDSFHYSGQRVINAKHPSGVFGTSNKEKYISDLCMQIIAKKAEILFYNLKETTTIRTEHPRADGE